MFTFKNDLFESEENEFMFKQICEKLRKHPFESPWKISTAPSSDEICYFYLTEIVDVNVNTSLVNETKIPPKCSSPCAIDFDFQEIPFHKVSESCETNLSILKESLMTIQDPHGTDKVKGMEIFSSISLSEVPQLCDVLKSSLLNEVALVLFLSAVLKIEKPLSLSIAAALVNHIAYPLVFQSKMNNSRNLLASILNFSEIYPKAIIDEIVIPCLKKNDIENLHLETLMKMTRCNLPNESVPYCIKSILELALPLDNTFSILQNVLERKIHLEKNIHDILAWKLEVWSTDHTKSVKFTKLIISILTIYGSELTDQFMIYHDIIERNETIMKRAAENVLKKLKELIFAFPYVF